jgi:hypothetical protein
MSDPTERFKARSEEGEESEVEGQRLVARTADTPLDEGAVLETEETEESEVEGHRLVTYGKEPDEGRNFDTERRA